MSGAISLRWAAAVVACLQAACLAGAPAEPALTVEDKSPTLWVRAGERLVMEYRYADAPFKPYARQLCTPAGRNVLLDAPADHLHHHGLMFAVAADGVDFWAETPRNGKQVHQSLTVARPAARRGGLPAAAFTQQLDWLGPDGKLRLAEQRTIEVCLVPDANATLLTWRSRLACPPGAASVKLTGSHYFGLGMRFLRSLDKVAAFRNAEGTPEKTGVHVRGAEHVAPSAWCAVAGPIDGRPITAAMFGHPDCPRFPVHWFTMPSAFAYLAGTMNLWKEPLTVEQDKPLELWYGVAVWDGKAGDDAVAALRNRWARWTAPKAEP